VTAVERAKHAQNFRINEHQQQVLQRNAALLDQHHDFLRHGANRKKGDDDQKTLFRHINDSFYRHRNLLPQWFSFNIIRRICLPMIFGTHSQIRIDKPMVATKVKVNTTARFESYQSTTLLNF
jgi:hypothetical protein